MDQLLKMSFVFRRVGFPKPSTHITLMPDYIGQCFMTPFDTFENSLKFHGVLRHPFPYIGLY